MFYFIVSEAIAVNTTSEELFTAVSTESWITPIIKPTATTCMAMSLFIPKRAQARGTRRSDPPATPEAPQAPMAEIKLRSKASAKVTVI